MDRPRLPSPNTTLDYIFIAFLPHWTAGPVRAEACLPGLSLLPGRDHETPSRCSINHYSLNMGMHCTMGALPVEVPQGRGKKTLCKLWMVLIWGVGTISTALPERPRGFCCRGHKPQWLAAARAPPEHTAGGWARADLKQHLGRGA